ncbi:hypothetical protein GCM10008090_04780 [Arenicella chitinivorans]|uniref:Bacterial sugar transferase domain-containing protein n=1 Tax=Arenicella chitinivorans TaxID=1329800 RepID=A0A918RHM5_9GAMM|nr:exopolysaccharide biosynthesis polyprenyl glycosylphosphotransferase [Arenicella chitinivorans]GGZ99243.1 hypothetical protein GCM10008090_04780 [Arenicella chitinivorans]
MNRGTIRSVRSLLILVCDLVALLTIFSGVYQLRLKNLPDYLSADLWLIVFTFISTLYLSGTYVKEKSGRLPRLPIRTFFVCIVGGGLCVLWVYLLGPKEFNNYFGRGVLPLGTLLFGIATTLVRYAVNSLYHLQESRIELLYVGYSPSTHAFLDELRNHQENRGLSILSTEKIDVEQLGITQISEFLSAETLKQGWQAIIIDPEFHPTTQEKSMLISAKLSGESVISLADYYESHWFMVPVNHISDEWFLHSQGFSMLGSAISARIKRLLDAVLAAALLILTAPIILFCCLTIKVTSRGPALFKQRRVGLRGTQFTIYKLRTMHQHAEASGAQWAQEDDPRVTRVGRFMRQTRLDELPQFWNVLRGEMSFVGPRPERPEFTDTLADEIPYYNLRNLVKPGISGWAQVIFPYGASTSDALRKLQYELYYIKHQSLLLDLNIMVRTLLTIFQRGGR